MVLMKGGRQGKTKALLAFTGDIGFFPPPFVKGVVERSETGGFLTFGMEQLSFEGLLRSFKVIPLQETRKSPCSALPRFPLFERGQKASTPNIYKSRAKGKGLCASASLRDIPSFGLLLFLALFLFLCVPRMGSAADASSFDTKPHSNPLDVPDDSKNKSWQDVGIDFDKIKERFFLFSNVTALASYSRLLGDSGLWGGNLSGFVAPAFKVNDKTIFLFLTNGQYSKTKTVYQEDKGSRVSSESITYTFTPTIKYDISDSLSISPSVFYTTYLSRQNTETRWRTDLYDYTDRGVGLSSNWTVSKTDKNKKDWNFVAQYYLRNYPNYSSLYTMAGLGSFEEKEKDSNSYLLSAEYNDKNAEKLSYRFFASVLMKRMIDKLVENAAGERDMRKQKDNLFSVENGIEYKANETFTYLLNTTVSYNHSNQNLASGTLPNIVFTKDYYGYYSVNAKPGLKYTTTLDSKEFSVKGSYGFTIQKYNQRRAKDALGKSGGAREQDLTHSLLFDATYKVHKNWDAIATTSFDVYRSNYRDEGTYRYNYEVFKFLAGFSYNY